MRKTLIVTALAACFAAPAFAQTAAPAETPEHTFTGNVTLASEYIYRGITQTGRKMAVQGGFDYSHSSGLYVGTWASNISWLGDTLPGTTAPIELDIYGGYKNTFAGGDWSYDVGLLTYNYPTSNLPAAAAKPDTTEVYGQLGYQWLTAKYSYVVSSHIFGWTTPTNGNTRGSGYLDVSASYDLGEGWGLVAHVGHQSIKGRSSASYTDYKLGFTKDTGFGVVGVSYVDTNAKGSCSKGEDYCWAGKDAGKGVGLVTFTKTL